MSVLLRQKMLVDFFHKQQAQEKVSHAYLLVGTSDTYELALYFVQSLFCKTQEIGACQTCTTCKRIANHEHGDFGFLSGRENSIKKEDVSQLKSRFIQTSLEQSPYKVYMIEDVDNASLGAMNSFLKFLEEPDSNIVAFLSTSNINKVLETIKSRCLILNLKSVDKETLKESLLKNEVSEEDASYLSYLAKDETEALSIYENPMYDAVKKTFLELMKYYNRNQYLEAGIYLQVMGIKKNRFDLQAIKWLCEFHEYHYTIQTHKQTDENTQNNLRLLNISTRIKDRIRPGVISSMLIDQFAFELSLEV